MKINTLVLMAENTPGVLNKIASLVRKKMYNVESLTAYESSKKGISRITIVVKSKNSSVIAQVMRQLKKIIEVLEVIDVSDYPSVKRELALIKVKAGNGMRAEISNLTDIFRGNIVDVSSGSMIVEITGSSEKIESAVKVFKDFGIVETARTGITAMLR